MALNTCTHVDRDRIADRPVVREAHRQWRSIGEAIERKSVTISLWNESETQPSLMQPQGFEELILVSTM